MVQSHISTIQLPVFIQLSTGLKNVRNQRSVKSIIQPHTFLMTQCHITHQHMIWICGRSLTLCSCSRTHRPRNGADPLMRSTIPAGLYEWKNGRTDKMTTRDLNILRNYAYKKGVKSIYYIRTFTDDQQEVGSNECESCVI